MGCVIRHLTPSPQNKVIQTQDWGNSYDSLESVINKSKNVYNISYRDK